MQSASPVLALAVTLAIAAGACTSGASSQASSNASVGPPAAPAVSATTAATLVPTAASRPSAAASQSASPCPRQAVGSFPHQAPEIENVLPATVAGRALTRWSIRGRCWLEVMITNPADIAPFVTHFTTASNPNPVNDTDLVSGVAGRSKESDPPFFVYAAVQPMNDAEVALVLDLLFGGAGYKDIAGGSDLSNYQVKTIAGKQVYVGTVDMLTQDTHQRGRPYLYQTDAFMFLVVTDQDAWAAEAVGQLP